MNRWNSLRGKISYLVLDEPELLKLISESDGLILGFEFGDSIPSSNICHKVRLSFIESVSISLSMILKDHDGVDYFLISDAYIMQSKSLTPIGKGSAIKGFLSTFISPVKRLNKTIIFTSENEDSTMLRNFKKLT